MGKKKSVKCKLKNKNKAGTGATTTTTPASATTPTSTTTTTKAAAAAAVSPGVHHHRLHQRHQVTPDVKEDHVVPDSCPGLEKVSERFREAVDLAIGFEDPEIARDTSDDDDAIVPTSPKQFNKADYYRQHDGSGDAADTPVFVKKATKQTSQCKDVATVVLAANDSHVKTMSKDIVKNPSEGRTSSRKDSLKHYMPIEHVKHYLQDSWAFWYYQGDKKKSWKENLLRVCDFDTVEDFWAMYNHTVQPSSLSPGRDFSLFKKGIRPEWEDPLNSGGGMWSVTLRERRTRSPEMDAVWAEVSMLLIGDQFDHLGPLVNGAAYSARKNQDRVSLWVKASIERQRDEIYAIGERLRKAVEFAGNNFVLEYATSDDWKNKAGPTVGARIILHMQ